MRRKNVPRAKQRLAAGWKIGGVGETDGSVREIGAPGRENEGGSAIILQVERFRAMLGEDMIDTNILRMIQG